MSAIPTIKVQDPQLDLVPRVYYAKMGGSDITHNSYQAVSATDSQVVFSTTTPSVNVGLSRRLYWEGCISVVIPPAIVNGSLPSFSSLLGGNGGTFGLRQFPLANLTDTLSLKLNNATVTVNLNDIIHAVMRFGSSPDERNKYMTGSPSFPDEVSSYVPTDFNGGLGARNPFAAYGTNIEEISRLPMSWLKSAVIAQNGPQPNPADPNGPPFPAYNGIRSCIIGFLEPLFTSPVNWSSHEVLSLFGVQTIDITLSLSSNIKNRIFCGAYTPCVIGGGGNGMDTAVVTLIGETADKPKLHVLYITPQINQPVPKLLYYPYYEVGRYITNGATLTPSTKFVNGVVNPGSFATNEVVSNITLHSVPKRLYVYCRPSKTTYDGLNGNTIPLIFARISRVSFNWNNRAGMLSSSSEYDLYRMSVRNGCDQSWPEWTTYQGSVLCIEPSTDLGLGPLEAPGSRGNYQLQYSIDYVNLFTNNTAVQGSPDGNIAYSVYTVVINEGFLTVNDSVISLDIGILTEDNIKEASWAPAGTFNEISNLYGGSFFGDLWRGIKKGAKIARDIITPISGLVSQVATAIPHPMAQKVGNIAGIVNKVGKATGGRARAGARGGNKMTKRSLSRRL